MGHNLQDASPRTLRVRAVLVLVVTVGVAFAGCAAPDPQPALPRVVVALGDSLTRATNAAGPGERPAASWATGHDSGDVVESFAERLFAAGAPLSGNVRNLATSGATMRDLEAQARGAVDLRADLVLVLMGANDVCRGSVAEMTSVEDVRARFRAAASVLRDGLPDATVYVVSVPDVGALYEAGKDDAVARERWRTLRVCPSLLDESNSEADRDAVQARAAAVHDVLMEEARGFGFATDGGAVRGAEVRLGHVSSFDAFHPSLAGQAAMAEVAWRAGPYAAK